ncbi:hypothetical protein DFH06DRAFT_1319828 [Mycena polygramma]|nr:hypothetical protein DFH06DRAFT_1319828 [Mycena polygramma]
MADAAHTYPPASERAALAADRARIADLDAQISDLESSLKSLKEKRKSAQDRLDAYTYPVLTLPHEITSEIFIRFLPAYPECPPPIGLLSPYLLCQICRKWRDIAFATPALWRAVSLSLRKPIRITQTLGLLEASLKRSGACLLSIDLRRDTEEASQLVPFSRAIEEHRARWEHLAVVLRALNNLPVGDPPLPRLRTFKLLWGDEDSALTSSTFLAAPLLRKVLIERFYNGAQSIFPWSQLTVLFVGGIRALPCVHILHQLVNVTSCRFRLSFDWDAGSAADVVPRVVTLPYLDILILEAGMPYRLTPHSILETLSLPALRQLNVSRNVFGPVSVVTSLISRSGCSIEELCISGTDPDTSLRDQDDLPLFTTFEFSYPFGNYDVAEPFLNYHPDSEDEDSDNDYGSETEGNL